AIRFEVQGPPEVTSLTATIFNDGTIQSGEDTIQIQKSALDVAIVTSGTLTITNFGSIESAIGQALDLAGGAGAFQANVTNAGSGTIKALVEDAIKFGGHGSLTNSSLILGGNAVGYTGADGVQFEDNAIGTVDNQFQGEITGERHGINGGIGSFVTVINAN